MSLWFRPPPSTRAPSRENLSKLSRRGLLGFGAATAIVTVGHAAGLKLHGGTYTPSAYVESIPSAQWAANNGVAGLGFGTSNPAAPVNPTRTSAKPWARPLWVNYQTVDKDTVLVLDSGALNPGVGSSGGIARVDVWNEGNKVTLTSEQFVDYVDENGNAAWAYGYCVVIKRATILALLAAGGAMQIVYDCYAVDGTMQNRVISQVCSMRPDRYDGLVKTIGPTGADFTSIKAFWDWRNADVTNRKRACGKIITSGNYPLANATSTIVGLDAFTTIIADTGVTAVMGDGTQSFTATHMDGICFRGAGIKWDTCALAYGLGNTYIAPTSATAFCWLDSVELLTGTPNAAAISHGVSGSGMTALSNGQPPVTSWGSNFWFTDVWAHDLAGYGPSSSFLFRGGAVDSVSGSCFAGMAALHNCTVNQISGILSGLRKPYLCMDITYTGSATVAQIEKLSVNGGVGLYGTITNAGSGYTPGTYGSTGAITATGGSGTNARLEVIVGAGGTVTAVNGATSSTGSILNATVAGYVVGDVLTVPASSLGGTGSGFQFTLTGNFNLVEDGVVTSSYQIGNFNTVAQVVASINAHGAGWSAVSTVLPGDPQFAACYMSTTPSVPSKAISRADGTLPASGTRKISPVLIIDAHTDVMPYDGAYENVAIRFLQVTNTVGSQWFFPTAFANLKDFGMRQCTSQDLSNVTTGAGSAEPSAFHGTFSHVVFDRNTYDGDYYSFGSNFVSSGNYNFVGRSVADAWSWNITVQTSVLIRGVASLASSFGSGFGDSLNKAMGGPPYNYTRSNLWVNPDGASRYGNPQSGQPTGTPPDYTPKNLGTSLLPVYALQLSDLTFAGAKVPAANFTAANRGWNF